MNGRIWWNRITNPAQFIEDTSDELISSESVILRLPEKLPWEEDFFESLRTSLEKYGSERTFKTVSAEGVTSPGDFLMEQFFTESERNKCWLPTYHTYENFMAQNSETVMNHRYVCVSNIEPGMVQDWVDSINSYLSSINDAKDERGVFILIVRSSGEIEKGELKEYCYSSYVTDFDCLLFCQTLLSSQKLTTIQKEYISHLAFNIAGNDYELAGVFAGYGLELANHPYRTAEKVFADSGKKVTNLKEKVNSALWNAQIKVIFPRMENERRILVEKYYKDLKKCLPIKNINGDKIEDPLELEVGHIFMLANKRRFADWGDYRMLEIMKDARNALAHLEAISFTALEDMSIF